MLKVLDHPLGARPRTFQAHAHPISRLLLSFVLYLFVSSNILAVAAQDVVNGQVVCQGFSTVDNPNTNSTLNAGSNTDISINVSVLRNTTLGIDLLEVYLVSSEAQKNVTVSSGPQVLSQEPGSTVKHIHWSVPTCLQTGTYNLTLYETSHLNDIGFFAITPIPIQIENRGNVADSCDSPENALQAQPQVSSPPPADVVSDTKSQTGASPSDVPNLSSSSGASQTITNSSTATATSGDATASGNATASATSSALTATSQPSSSSDGGSIITITAGDGDITVGITGLPGTIVIEPSGGGPSQTMVASSTGFVTIFKTVAPTATATLTEIISAPVTITLEETYVSTVTASGTTEAFTVTQTVLSTTELVATQVSSPQQAGLLPINSGSITLLPSALLFQTSLLACAVLYVLRSFL